MKKTINNRAATSTVVHINKAFIVWDVPADKVEETQALVSNIDNNEYYKYFITGSSRNMHYAQLLDEIEMMRPNKERYDIVQGKYIIDTKSLSIIHYTNPGSNLNAVFNSEGEMHSWIKIAKNKKEADDAKLGFETDKVVNDLLLSSENAINFKGLAREFMIHYLFTHPAKAAKFLVDEHRINIWVAIIDLMDTKEKKKAALQQRCKTGDI